MNLMDIKSSVGQRHFHGHKESRVSTVVVMSDDIVEREIDYGARSSPQRTG